MESSTPPTEKSVELHHPVNHAAPHDLLSAVEAGTVSEVPHNGNKLYRIANRLEALVGIEARGIERVPESMRASKTTVGDYVQIALIWFSANITANNLAIGLLGPAVFYLGLKDAMIIGTFGTLTGAAGTAYISTYGPLSGNRTLVFARYNMGWWPSKLAVALNLVIMLGYGLVDTLICGQILSAVAGGSLTVVVGTIIAALISLLVALFGIKVFHVYERYAFIPQLCVLFILVGVAGPKFNAGSVSVGDSSAILSADKMSFFFLCMSAPIAWAPAGCDFFVYFPPSASRWTVFMSTIVGLGVSSAMMVLLGVGLASGSLTDDSWAAASEISAGALITEAYRPLGTFGHFCAVIVGLGLISNNIPGTYSAALSFQLLGSWFRILPRLFWTVFGCIIYTICACVGRNHLFSIFEDFLALMGYWVVMWIVIVLEEDLLFRRKRGYQWADWDVPSMLPIGIAALIAFLIGWVGAVLSMYQVYFTGPIAKLVGDGIDLGIPVSASWTAIFYPPLRYLELKKFGR